MPARNRSMPTFIAVRPERTPPPAATVNDFRTGFRNMETIRDMLPTIRSWMTQVSDTAVTESQLVCRRDRQFEIPMFSAYADAIVLLTVRKGFLANFSERFVFPENDLWHGLAFHRESFDVDSQAVSSAPLELERFWNVMQNPTARLALSNASALITETVQTGQGQFVPSSFPVARC